MGLKCQFASLPESQAAQARCTSTLLATEERQCPAVSGKSSEKKPKKNEFKPRILHRQDKKKWA